MSPLFNYDHLQLRYEPFPIGVAKPLMDEAHYREMLEHWPQAELFKAMPDLGHKYALSEKFNIRQYHDIISTTPFWREFHRWIKTDDFIDGITGALVQHHVDLGYGKRKNAGLNLFTAARRALKGKSLQAYAPLSARFEFQMMPAQGGYLLPHTDNPSKIITLVVSIVGENEWNPALGGGTDINRPRDYRLAYNHLNRQAEFADMELIDSFEFQPNQAVIFVKTFNSWHSVRPMSGTDPALMRRTLVINIETRQ
jgi:hypothetical protein